LSIFLPSSVLGTAIPQTYPGINNAAKNHFLKFAKPHKATPCLSTIFKFYLQHNRLTFFFTLFAFCFTLSAFSFYLSASQVENIGFEPMTPCLQGRCSSQLS
jgi:hypothetical protein